jgi:hypothetical protein
MMFGYATPELVVGVLRSVSLFCSEDMKLETTSWRYAATSFFSHPYFPPLTAGFICDCKTSRSTVTVRIGMIHNVSSFYFNP